MPTATDRMLHVCSLDQLAAQKQVVVQGHDRPIVVFHNGGQVRAVDNRCPHMGFPLHKGSCEGGIVTCHWHHARFDAASGCTFDLFAGDVQPFDIEVRAGQVYVSPRPRARDEVAAARQLLKEGMEQNLGLSVAKALLALRSAGVPTAEIVREAAVHGTSFRDSWGPGLTSLTALANLVPYLSEETAFLALYQGIRRVAADSANQPPRTQRQPLDTDELPIDTLQRWLCYWTTVRHRIAAERTLLTAIANGHEVAQLNGLVMTAATERFYAGGGHLLDFSNKAFELAEHVGHDLLRDILPTLMDQLASARGGEELNGWRHPIDLVPLVTQAIEELMAAAALPRRSWTSEVELAHAMLGEDPRAILKAIIDAARSGAAFPQLTKALAYAAALRIARFGTSNEIGDWVTALHTFTYCNALHQAVKRSSHPAMLRGLLHGAMSVYLDRFLNVPPAKLPGERGELDALPSDPAQLLTGFLDSLNTQHQVSQAAQMVARYLQLNHPTDALLDTLTLAVAREDADFHVIQMVEAAAAQHREWGNTPQGHHILIAAARYLAAHSPTQRRQLQTARMALRLHRGERVYEEEEQANA